MSLGLIFLKNRVLQCTYEILYFVFLINFVCNWTKLSFAELEYSAKNKRTACKNSQPWCVVEEQPGNNDGIDGFKSDDNSGLPGFKSGKAAHIKAVCKGGA